MFDGNAKLKIKIHIRDYSNREGKIEKKKNEIISAGKIYRSGFAGA